MPRVRRLSPDEWRDYRDLRLRALVAWARDAGAARVVLEVTRGNEAAERTYARAGFEPDGARQPLRPGSPLVSQSMTLEL